MKPYYYVYRVGGDAPKLRYSTLELAANESTCLAAQYPSDNIEILKCLGVSRTNTPATFWMDGVAGPRICGQPATETSNRK